MLRLRGCVIASRAVGAANLCGVSPLRRSRRHRPGLEVNAILKRPEVREQLEKPG